MLRPVIVLFKTQGNYHVVIKGPKPCPILWPQTPCIIVADRRHDTCGPRPYTLSPCRDAGKVAVAATPARGRRCRSDRT